MQTNAKYTKPVRINYPAKTPPIDVRKRTAGGYYLPQVEKTTPPVGERIYLVYLNDGSYYGWMGTKEANKWLFTMYYATGNKYQIYTKKPRYYEYGVDTHKIVKEKATGNTALVFAIKTLSIADTIDAADVKAQVAATIKEVDKATETYNGKISDRNINDPFGLLKKVLPKAAAQYNADIQPYNAELGRLYDEYAKARKAIEQEALQGPEAKYRQNLIDHLNDLSQAQDEKQKGSEEADANLDF